ncbi:hypothetical protein AB3M74_20710 [Serratia ureilytica]|uniref:hypothetical protein n=1 Tax=Serratia ureilytica TaxID=300181 RepID=UPI00371F3250
MELLHIGYFGDSACGKLLTDEIQEYGHQVSFISLEHRPTEKLDLIITTENNAETIRRLQQQGKNLLTLATNKKILTTLTPCKTKNTFLCTLAPLARPLICAMHCRIWPLTPNFPCCRKGLSTLWSSCRVVVYRRYKNFPTAWRVNTMPNHRRACAN